MSRKAVAVRLRSGGVVAGIVADVCGECGERYFDAEAMRRLEAAARRANNGARGRVR